MQTHCRWLFATALAVSFSPAVMGAPPAAQSPWSKVPAFPTGCYSGRDDFETKIVAAQEAMSKEIARQEQINNQLKERYESTKANDPWAEAARVQNLMAENPQKAMEMAQKGATARDTMTDLGPRDTANQKKLDAELADLSTRYRAAVEKATAPVDARLKESDKRAENWETCGEMACRSRRGVSEHNALVKQWNGEYEQVCSTWWQASGPFQSWLKRYRDHLVQDHIPWLEQAGEAGAGNLALYADTSAAGYKSTATMDAVVDYMRRAGEVFNNREREPFKLEEYGTAH
jgi:hypothetical protein